MSEYTSFRVSKKPAGNRASRNRSKGQANRRSQGIDRERKEKDSRQDPSVEVIARPDVLFTKLESLKTENEAFKEKLAAAREQIRKLRAEVKKLKSDAVATETAAPARETGIRKPVVQGSIRNSLLELKEILSTMPKAKVPFWSTAGEIPVKDRQKDWEAGESDDEKEMDDPVLRSLGELKGIYRVPMPVLERMQTELAFVRGQRTQALELVRAMHELLDALGRDRSQIEEKISFTSEKLDRILHRVKE